VVFSGDIGPAGMAILRDAVPFKRANVVLMESTYGDRDNKPLKETLAEFRSIVEEAVQTKAACWCPRLPLDEPSRSFITSMSCFAPALSNHFPFTWTARWPSKRRRFIEAIRFV